MSENKKSMPTIKLTEDVKIRLEKYKNMHGCKTYNEAVNILLTGSILLEYLKSEKEKEEEKKPT